MSRPRKDLNVPTIFRMKDVKLRQFAELLCKTIAANHALYLGEREAFEETLRRLGYERILPKEVADVFHALGKAGNRAAHDATGTHSDALSALKFARQLGIWFHRTYGKQPDFKPGPFAPPPELNDAKEEIEKLRRRVVEMEDAAEHARREAEEHACARESAEDRLKREAEERAIWEQLARETEAEKAKLIELRSVLPAPPAYAPIAEADSRETAHLQALSWEGAL